jgi:hypothetical protein
MKRPDTWIVKPEDGRPARPDGTCFYCGEPIGGKHKYDCVIPQKAGLDDTCLAWGFIKEKEPHNSLKQLYSKYVLKDEEDLII